VENLSTLSRGGGREKKGEISHIIANFGEITKILNLALCKTSFFPHSFPQPVEKGGRVNGGMFERSGKHFGKLRVFNKGSMTHKTASDQLPLISLIISSISARKTGFCTMRFSTASREDRTVEWSLSMILPILGRDISVIRRITYTVM